MAKQEDIKFWSKKYGHPVTDAEVDEINFNLKAFANWLYDRYVDLRKKGLIDKDGNFLDEEKSEVSN